MRPIVDSKCFQNRARCSSFSFRLLSKRWLLLVFLLGISSGAVPAKGMTTENDCPLRQQGSSQSLDQTYFHEHPIGKTLRAYFECEDSDCVDALRAVENLGEVGITPLAAILERVPAPLAQREGGEPWVKVRALKAFGKTASAAAFECVKPLFADSHPLVRATAVETASLIAPEQAKRHLVPLLRDVDPFVREQAATALARIGTLEVLAALRAAAKVETVPHVRAAIAAAIADISSFAPSLAPRR